MLVHPNFLQKQPAGRRRTSVGHLCGFLASLLLKSAGILICKLTWRSLHGMSPCSIGNTVDGNQKSGKLTSWGNGSLSHYSQGFIHRLVVQDFIHQQCLFQQSKFFPFLCLLTKVKPSNSNCVQFHQLDSVQVFFSFQKHALTFQKIWSTYITITI